MYSYVGVRASTGVLTFNTDDSSGPVYAVGVRASAGVLAGVALLQVRNDKHTILVNGASWQVASILGP